MKTILDRFRSRIGEFWWYSIILFMAMRSADLLNLFVGVWLVPKFISPDELGAVLPLASFAALLATPVSAFAMSFMKEITSLATAKEFGKMKALLSGVFAAALVFLMLSILLSRIAMPFFMDSIRISEGSLGILILASGFIGAFAPVYVNALQGLKKFRELSLLHVLCAPVRLLTMLVAMPFRPLSGYFAGQSASPAANIALSVFFLRRELAVKADAYWRRPAVKRFLVLFLLILAYQLSAAMLGFAEQTVFRRNLPNAETAAFYMLTRFSDILGFVSGVLLAVLFPYTAEAAERGESLRPLVIKTAAAIIAAGILLSSFFAIAGKWMLAVLPGGETNASFAWALPALTGINILFQLQCLYTNTEASAARFGFLKWWIPLNLILPFALLWISPSSIASLIAYLALAAAVKFAFSLCGFLSSASRFQRTAP